MISRWYSYLLQQMAAECYFEKVINFSPNDELAQALSDGNNRNITSDRPSGLTRFSDDQAAEFMSRFRILDQWSDNPNRSTNLSPADPGYLELNGQQILANSGFSATLIENVDPASGELGTMTLSIRSSEYALAGNGGDKMRDVVGADISAIAGKGFAFAQLDALERYVEWLRAKGLLAPLQKINLTGYSLGGHLATLFAEIHPDQVEAVYSFNGAGRGEWDRSQGTIQDALGFYRSVLADPTVAASSANTVARMALYAAAMLNSVVDPVSIYGSARYLWAMSATAERFNLRGNAFFFPFSDQERTGLTNGASSLVTQILGHSENGDAEYVANSGVHGPSHEIFVEDQPDIQGILPFGDQFDFGTSHSLTLLGDSLAVMRLFEQMDPLSSRWELNKIFSAASVQRASTFFGALAQAEGDSLEKVVVALGKLFNAALIPMEVDRSPSGFANLSNRNEFHENLSLIEEKLSGGRFFVRDLTEVTSRTLEAYAKTSEGIAFLYALRELNPFAVVDASGKLYERFENADPGEGELVYVPGDYTGTINDRWIEGRAELLFFANSARMNDRTDENGNLLAATGETIYSAYDAPGGRLTILPNGFFVGEQRFVTFGDENGNELVGQGKSDRLFGGGGHDTVSGIAGADWIQGDGGADRLYGGNGDDYLYGGIGDDFIYGENDADRLNGGAGDDWMSGGEGADVLAGGSDNDTLDGGGGNDQLAGGEGFDTYRYANGGDVDTVVDSDGSGQIEINGQAMHAPEGGFSRVGTVWTYVHGDEHFMFHLDGSLATGGDLIIFGSFEGKVRVRNFKNGDLGIVLAEGPGSLPPASIKVLDQQVSRKSFGTNGDDVAVMRTDYGFFLGLGGNDVLGEEGNATYSAEQFYGNGGDDLIVGSDAWDEGYGGDILIGGGGADRILGGAYSDALFGDASAALTVKGFKVDSFRYTQEFGEEVGRGFFYHEVVNQIIDSVEFIFESNVEALRWILGEPDTADLPEFFNDYLDGGSGNDQLHGMAGSDVMYGGEGDDRLTGDVDEQLAIYMESGADAGLLELLGQYGDDYLDGGAGNDKLSDQTAGSDAFIGGDGDDQIENRERIPGRADNRLYYAGSLSGLEAFSNYLDGGSGNDILRSVNTYAGGTDTLIGGAGNDSLQASGAEAVEFFLSGGEGDDQISTGAGRFKIDGGSGSDVYRIFGGLPALSPLSVTISDRSAIPFDGDRIELNLLASIDDLTFLRSNDDLLIGLVGKVDWITVSDWFMGSENKIESLVIQPVSGLAQQWDVTQIERQVVWSGSSGPDFLSGGDGNDSIQGGAGADEVRSGEGDDSLSGGAGNDELLGGGGDDIYYFHPGDGMDRIRDTGGNDTLVMDDGTVSTEVSVLRSSGELRILMGLDEVIIEWRPELGYQIENIVFSDGVTWDASTLEGLMVWANSTPIQVLALPDQTLLKSEFFRFSVPDDAFIDADESDELSYGATLADGSPLPAWLSFDAVSRTFSGTPMGTVENPMYIKITASDSSNASAFSYFQLEILGTETAIHGTDGANHIVATSADERIFGFGGDDILEGAGGADFMAGGSGNDIYIVSGVEDFLSESSGEGVDGVISAVTWTLGTNIENLTLVGHADVDGIGNMLGNVITGNSGANNLKGRGGDDSYFVDLEDVVTEMPGRGIDTIHSSISWVLGRNVERLILIGDAAINGTGNTMDNVLVGNGAKNVLSGGAGNDSYFVSDGDIVRESIGQGEDSIFSDVSWTLGASLEHLTLIGSESINAHGNTSDNVMIGNSSDNILDGGGGSDVLAGGEGDDTYVIDSTADVVSEEVNGGIDAVLSSITFSLRDHLEILILSGSAAINATGNATANLLIGNTGGNMLAGGVGNDILQGMEGNDVLTDSRGNSLFDGGSGADSLTGNGDNEMFIGGIGNDTITTGVGADIIAFNAGAGQDLVNASTGADNTISLGGGIVYDALTFTRAGSDLVLNTGGTGKLTLAGWYAGTTNKSVTNLQVIAEAMAGYNPGGGNTLLDNKIEIFDFAALASAFDTAGQINNWALTEALLSAHLSGSDVVAIGGDLAYQYGRNATLTGLELTSAQDVINSGQFGSNTQTLRPLQDLQQGQILLN